jgi:hypothetical protein
MSGELVSMKSLLSVLAIFLCLGLLLAREVLSRFGLESSYWLMAVCAAVFTALLTGRSVALMAVVLTLGLVLNVPAATLGGIAVDQDLLLAALLGVIVLPLVHRLVLR